MTNLTFYTNPMSRGRIARWMLEEVGEPYETVLLDYGESGMKSAGYLAVNPMGKVPAIVHGGAVVTEAAAICAYLADAFPEKGLAPPLGAERASYYRWLFFAAGPVEAAVTNKSLGFESDRTGMIGYGTYDATMAALEKAVSAAPYICGDRFTAADVYVGAQIGWGLMFKSMPALPAFVDYAGRMQAREAFQRAAALDDAAMPKQEG